MTDGHAVAQAHPAKPAAATAGAARTRLLLEGPIVPTLLRLAAPNVLNLLAFAGMITFDGFFLGRISTNALAGASLAFPWVMLIMQATNSGMGAGVSSAVSRALGAGRRDRADDLVFHAFLLALALGALYSAVMLLGAPFMFQWMGGRDEMLADALAYANVALGSAVCICVLNLLGNAVRGTGNMSLPAGVLVGCVLAHIAISPALIFGLGPLPALGPAGAGWGLVIPFGVGSLVMIGYLRSRRSTVRLKFRGVMPRWELFADILKVGVPGLVNTAITNMSVAVLTGIAGQLGPETAIGYAMGARLEYIQQPVAFGFGTAIVAMVGTNWGAKQYRRAREIAWTGAAICALLCGTIGSVVAIYPSLWINLFSDSAEVARIGALYLRIVGPVYVCFGLGLGLFFVTLGVGRPIAAMNANAVRMIASAVGGLVAIYGLDLGVTGFFAAVAAGFCIYAALLVRAVIGVRAPDESPAIPTTSRPAQTVRRTVAGAALALGLGTGAAHAADLNVVSEPETAQALTDLKPRIEGLTHRHLVVTVATPGALARAQNGREPFDAVVVYAPDTVALLASNHLVDRMFCIGWTRQGQQRTPIYAAVSRTAKEPGAAQRLVAFLSSFEGLMALTAHGLDGTPNE